MQSSYDTILSINCVTGQVHFHFIHCLYAKVATKDCQLEEYSWPESTVSYQNFRTESNKIENFAFCSQFVSSFLRSAMPIFEMIVVRSWMKDSVLLFY